jgi:hypothetical protein
MPIVRFRWLPRIVLPKRYRMLQTRESLGPWQKRPSFATGAKSWEKTVVGQHHNVRPIPRLEDFPHCTHGGLNVLHRIRASD